MRACESETVRQVLPTQSTSSLEGQTDTVKVCIGSDNNKQVFSNKQSAGVCRGDNSNDR